MSLSISLSKGYRRTRACSGRRFAPARSGLFCRLESARVLSRSTRAPPLKPKPFGGFLYDVVYEDNDFHSWLTRRRPTVLGISRWLTTGRTSRHTFRPV